MLALSAVLTAGLIGYKSVLSIHGDTLRVPKYGDCDDEFATYVKEFARSSEDSVFRREIFCKNLEFIERHNRLNVIKDGYFLKVGPHADRLPHEVATGGLNFTDFVRTDTRAAELGSRSMESSVDWRSRMPPIKNQHHCGSCWAFSAIDVIDFAAGGSHSEQQLIDCTGQGDSCKSGSAHEALEQLAKSGSASESAYRYTGKDGSCKRASPAAKVSNVRKVQISSAASDGVVSFCISCCSQAFHHYGGGKFTGSCADSENGGHCLGVVGLTNSYYIVRNSWGAEWGDEGYIYISRDGNCGREIDGVHGYIADATAYLRTIEP